MAEYRPLVERLVSSLSERDAEARASAYDRLRKALENQFGTGLEGDQRRDLERLALAKAIADVEAEIRGDTHESDVPPGEDADARSDGLAKSTLRGSTPPADRVSDSAWTAPGRSAPSSRKVNDGFSAALAVSALCALLIGAGVWWSLHADRPAAIVDEDDPDTVGGTGGASVPRPVGQLDAVGAARWSTSVVTQRAALIVNAPSEPLRLKTYTGSVIWRLARPERASGAAASSRVEADVDIPEVGMRVEIAFDKNATPQLPASHIAQIRFIRQSGGLLGRIDQIDLPEMRNTDAQTGDRLVGSRARVTDDVFLIGLSDADHGVSNLLLIQSRGWLDLPILFQGHREAKLTFEKGATGDAVWDEALAVWGRGFWRASPPVALRANQSR